MTATKKVPKKAITPKSEALYMPTAADKRRMAPFRLVEGAANWLRVQALQQSIQGATHG